MRKKAVFIILLLLTFSGFSQEQEVNFTKKINELNRYGKQIISSKDDSVKYALNQKFNSLLLEVMSNPASFNYNFDSLKTISILKARQLKIYNWAIPKTNGNFEYFAYVTIWKGKENYNVIELIDKSDNIKSPENKTLAPKMWYGAWYYKIINHKKIGKNYYTLLGWDGNNNLTNKKIIDVIQVDNKGSIKIGAPIFKMAKKTQRRLIFEYSNNAVMSLKYFPNLEKIVYDYLEPIRSEAPSSTNLEGLYEYYGPSLNSFDALIMEKGKWLYEPNTEILLEKSLKDGIWNDPNK